MTPYSTTEWNEKLHRRAIELRNMRILATSLLLLMLVVFVFTTIFADLWAGMAYIRAFSEAAMVGACADWFALVALFRHPFGIPIPHTAIIARNQARIGESLGGFICNNFLAPEIVAGRLGQVDFSSPLVKWLTNPNKARQLAKGSLGLLPPIIEELSTGHANKFSRDLLASALRAVQAAPFSGRVLSALIAHKHHQALFEQCLDGCEQFLAGHKDHIRNNVSDRTWAWLPTWVDHKLADKIILGLEQTLAELRNPRHPWRQTLQERLDVFCERLKSDPELNLKAEDIKQQILKNPLIESYLDSLLGEISKRLLEDIKNSEGIIVKSLEEIFLNLGEKLKHDENMKAILNHWIKQVIQGYIVPHRSDISAFISSIVSKWDSVTLIGKLELQVGKDLQYIRINGTLVGGLVGLIIFCLSKIIW